MKSSAAETCPHCGTGFPTEAHRAYASPLKVLAGIEPYRGPEGQLRHDSRVRCPKCHRTFESVHVRFFGLFTARALLYTLVVALFVAAATFWFIASRG